MALDISFSIKRKKLPEIKKHCFVSFCCSPWLPVKIDEKNKMNKHKSLSLTPFTKANLKLQMITQPVENNNYYRCTRQKQMLSSVNEIEACEAMTEASEENFIMSEIFCSSQTICRACDPPNTQSQELHCIAMYSFTANSKWIMFITRKLVWVNINNFLPILHEKPLMKCAFFIFI